jgi:guanine nucleotide-binding protein G(i) subunit alpha
MVSGISALWEEWRAAKQARARSHNIDRQIEEDAKTLRRTCSVLLMGSRHLVLCYILSLGLILSLPLGINHPDIYTIARQLKMSQHGYSREELLDFRLSIWRYLLETSHRVVQALHNSGLEPATYANKVRLLKNSTLPHDVVIPAKANCERILNHPTDTNHAEFHFQPGFADAVQELWADDILPVLFDSPAYISLADPCGIVSLFTVSGTRRYRRALYHITIGVL